MIGLFRSSPFAPRCQLRPRQFEMSFLSKILWITVLVMAAVLPTTLAVRSARVLPIDPEPQSPPPESRVNMPVLVTRWDGLTDDPMQLYLRYHLRHTYGMDAAHLEPAHYDPVTLEELEQQIRESGNQKRFIQLGQTAPGRSAMRVAFALQNTYQGHGQKYFALLHVGMERRAISPYIFSLGFVKASGVYGFEDAIPVPADLRNARVVTLHGAPLTANEMLRAALFL